MKYKKLILLALITFIGSIACHGQKVSNEKECTEIWELSCEKATELLKIKAQYPLQIQRNTELIQLLAEQKVRQEKTEKKLKRKLNLTKIGAVAFGIVMIVRYGIGRKIKNKR